MQPVHACTTYEAFCVPQLGELLHGEEFSMFEAMSAVEIGDPKLDAGLTVDYLVPADRWSPVSVAARIESPLPCAVQQSHFQDT